MLAPGLAADVDAALDALQNAACDADEAAAEQWRLLTSLLRYRNSLEAYFLHFLADTIRVNSFQSSTGRMIFVEGRRAPSPHVIITYLRRKG